METVSSHDLSHDHLPSAPADTATSFLAEEKTLDGPSNDSNQQHGRLDAVLQLVRRDRAQQANVSQTSQRGAAGQDRAGQQTDTLQASGRGRRGQGSCLQPVPRGECECAFLLPPGEMQHVPQELTGSTRPSQWAQGS
eukprot:474740-Hanusia_phi.AAC.2